MKADLEILDEKNAIIHLKKDEIIADRMREVDEKAAAKNSRKELGSNDFDEIANRHIDELCKEAEREAIEYYSEKKPGFKFSSDWE